MKTKDVAAVNQFLSAGEQPYKSYIKTIIGKVAVIFWDNYENKPASMILVGDHRKGEETSIVNTFSEKEDAYFRKTNKRLFQLGLLVPYEHPKEAKRERTLEEYSDAELTEIVNKPFLALQNVLNKAQTEAVLFRILSIAQEQDKSEKTIRAIESRLSEVQEASMPTPITTIEEEL